MSKKALFNFSTDGVLYEKGKVYSDEEVAHIDQSNFEGAVAEETSDNGEIGEISNNETIAPELDTEEKKKEEVSGTGLVEDEQEDDLELYEGESKDYKIIGEVYACDEEGELLEKPLEIGSIQENIPVIIGEEWVKEGLAEEVIK